MIQFNMPWEFGFPLRTNLQWFLILAVLDTFKMFFTYSCIGYI